MSTLTVTGQYPSEAEQLLITSESFRAMHRRAQAAESRVKRLEAELFTANCHVRTARAFAQAEIAPSLTRGEAEDLIETYYVLRHDHETGLYNEPALGQAREAILKAMGVCE